MGSQVRVLYCPPSSRTKKDIYAKNPEVSTASGFFCAHFLKLEKKISKRVLAKSVDLNLYARDFGPLFRSFFGKAARFCSRQSVEFWLAFLLVLPNAHSKHRGREQNKTFKDVYGWGSSTICNILEKREYLGHTINFKTRKHFKDKKSHYVPEDEWTIFENTHEAIIDQQTFDLVQKIRGNVRRYENFDKLTIAMLNEFIEKILVHERDRKGSIQTTQEVEIYFNFVGRFVPPAFGEVELTPEELEEIRKREERKDRLHQNYLKRIASGAQKRYEDKIKGRKKAEIEAKKAAIRAEDIAKGVFVPVSSLPQREPQKGTQIA